VCGYIPSGTSTVAVSWNRPRRRRWMNPCRAGVPGGGGDGNPGRRAAGDVKREGRHHVVPAFPVFPQQKETLWGSVVAAGGLELVVDLGSSSRWSFTGKSTGPVPFVFCGEQAQFQQVFEQAGVGADGVVVGHAEFCCHGLLPCAW
jgi:hypothetical protein